MQGGAIGAEETIHAEDELSMCFLFLALLTFNETNYNSKTTTRAAGGRKKRNNIIKRKEYRKKKRNKCE